jgi:hypothetical protein
MYIVALKQARLRGDNLVHQVVQPLIQDFTCIIEREVSEDIRRTPFRVSEAVR